QFRLCIRSQRVRNGGALISVKFENYDYGRPLQLDRVEGRFSGFRHSQIQSVAERDSLTRLDLPSYVRHLALRVNRRSRQRGHCGGSCDCVVYTTSELKFG